MKNFQFLCEEFKSCPLENKLGFLEENATLNISCF